MPSTRTKGQFGAHNRSRVEENGTGRSVRTRDRSGSEKSREPKDDPAYITSGALNVTKNGSIAAGVLAVLSAIPVFLKALNVDTLPDSAIYGAFALTGLCVIAVTVLIRTDMQTRATAKTSALEHPQTSLDAIGGRSVPEEIEGASEDEVVYDAPGAAVPLAEPFTVKLHDGVGRFRVLAAGWNPTTGTPAYLCGRPGEKPRWIDDDEIQAADDYEPDVSPSLDASEYRRGH